MITVYEADEYKDKVAKEEVKEEPKKEVKGKKDGTTSK